MDVPGSKYPGIQKLYVMVYNFGRGILIAKIHQCKSTGIFQAYPGRHIKYELNAIFKYID